MRGLGIYWILIEFLRQQSDYKGSMVVLKTLARKARVSMTTIERVIRNYELFCVENSVFLSPGLIKRMEPLEAKREANKESGRRGGLANQQKIRSNKASAALAEDKNNEINNSPSTSPQGETRKEKEETILDPPAYALNKQTHNYEGLAEELARQKVTSAHELNAIFRLSDFGRLGGKVWKILYDLNNSPQMRARIMMPGKYILKLLQNKS